MNYSFQDEHDFNKERSHFTAIGRPRFPGTKVIFAGATDGGDAIGNEHENGGDRG